MQTTFLFRGLVASALLVLIHCPSQLRAQEYEVEGTIRECVPQDQLTNSAAFTVYVRDCAWLIETAETNSAGRTEQRRIGSTNGSEIFQIIPAGGSVMHGNGGQVISNDVPIGSSHDSIIPHLWIMFASQCYFRSQNVTNRLMPVYDVDPMQAGKADLRLEADWELMSGKIPLPLKVIYYNPGGFYIINTDKEFLFQAYGPPYKRGFTDAKYAVTAMTNFDGVSFPAGFNFAEFQPGGGLSRYDLRARRTAEAVVTAFRPKCSREDLLPAIQGLTLVRDLRLAHAIPPVKSFSYRLQKGGHWSTVTEAKQLHF